MNRHRRRDEDHLTHLRRYVNDLCAILGPQISDFAQALKDFVEVGAVTVEATQEATRGNLTSMATIATFFSVVASAMIGVSLTLPTTPLTTIVHLSFIGSLVFSIVAIIQTLWALGWDQSS